MIVRAIVKDNRDPKKKGRIKVTIPSQSGPQSSSDWIWPVVTSGYIVTPKAGEQVWVIFENDDKEMPVWIGMTKDSVGYRTLLERVEDLEDKVTALEAWVAAHG